MKEINVSIFQILKRDICAYRDEMQYIRNTIKEKMQSTKENVKVINVDFKEITLVSHSFAEEIFSLKEYFEKQNKKVEFINMNGDVRTIYNINKSKKMKNKIKVIRLKLNDDQAHHIFGFLMEQFKNDADREKWIRGTIKLNPNNAEAHHILGCLLSQFDKSEKALDLFEEAKKEYRKAIQINPDYVEPEYNLRKLLLYLQ